MHRYNRHLWKTKINFGNLSGTTSVISSRLTFHPVPSAIRPRAPLLLTLHIILPHPMHHQRIAPYIFPAGDPHLLLVNDIRGVRPCSSWHLMTQQLQHLLQHQLQLQHLPRSRVPIHPIARHYHCHKLLHPLQFRRRQQHRPRCRHLLQYQHVIHQQLHRHLQHRQ